MLEALRRGAQTWVAKLLFGILVISFSFWGVADVFRGWGRGSLAKVGNTDITPDEFSRSFQNELDRFSRQANKRISAEQGRALGLDKRVMNQLISGTAIETHAEELGLALSDKAIVDMVTNDAQFKGPDGKFSREGFNGLLRQLGLSEQGYIRLRRRDELRADLIDSFVKAQVVAKPILETVYAYNQEKRTIEYLNLDPEKAVTVAEPDEAKLKERFEAGKSAFMTPEYRKFEVMFLSVDDLKKSVEVTDEEINVEYEKTKESYNVPEKRRIQQIAFADKAAAEAAKKAIDDGSKTFGDAAKDAGAKDTDADLGLIAKAALIDKKIAEAAFALEKDKLSGVIDGTFATVLLRVTQIEPGVTKTLADVKDEVKDKLATSKARLLLQEKHDEIDDSRNAGKSLKEIAESMKLTFKEIPASDRRGLAPDGKPALETPDARKVVEAAFAPDTNDQTSTELADGSYAWVNTLSTEAPKQKAFDEVKEEVKAQFMSSERTRLLAEFAVKLTERVNAGEPMSALETVAGNTVQKTDPVTRTTVPQGLSEAAVAQAFTLQTGKASSAESADKQSRTIIRVTEVTPAGAPAKEELDKLSKQMETDFSNQALVEYTEALKKRLGTSINEVELKRVFGASEE